jgi:hypothetical protein
MTTNNSAAVPKTNGAQQAFPRTPEWFNTEVRSGRVVVCDQIILELIRLAPKRDPRASYGMPVREDEQDQLAA